MVYHGSISLPLDLKVKLQNNDIAFHVHHLEESIPYEAFEPFLQNESCPAYHPRIMLNFIIFILAVTHIDFYRTSVIHMQHIYPFWIC